MAAEEFQPILRDEETIEPIDEKIMEVGEKITKLKEEIAELKVKKSTPAEIKTEEEKLEQLEKEYGGLLEQRQQEITD